MSRSAGDRARADGGEESPIGSRGGVWLVLAFSLGLRLLHLLTVAGSDAPPLFDEQAYLDRARGFEAIVRAWAGGAAAPVEAVDRAYGGGTWPPLHPLVLAASLSLGHDRLGAARFAMTVLSALTTFFVYRTARRFAGAGSALPAAWIHALYPSFLSYSALLWSETTFLFLLFVLADRLPALRGEPPPSWRRIVGVASLGGLLVLTRVSAVLLVLLLLGLSLGWRRQWRARLLALALTATVIGAVVLPWQAWISARERASVALSTATGLNLLMANSPWRDEPQGASLPFLDHQARLAAARDGVHPDAAARRLALDWIVSHPAEFGRGLLIQLRRLADWDLFLVRALTTVAYPPLPGVVLVGLLVAVVAAFALFGGLAALGGLELFRERRASAALLAAVAAALALPPLLSISNPRLGLPVLGLLLPFAGRGWLRFRRREAGLVPAAASVLVALLLVGSAATLGARSRPVEERSSLYRELPPSARAAFGIPATTYDALEWRGGAGAPRVRIEILEPAYAFVEGGIGLELELPRGRTVRGAVRGTDALNALRLRVTALDGGGSEVVTPIARDHWRSWVPILGGALELKWHGAVKARRVERGLEPWTGSAISDPTRGGSG